MIGPEEHKCGCTVVKVVRELPAWQALGPNGDAVAALIERCKTLTNDEAKRLDAARDAAWDAARNAARGAARNAARNAARDAARTAARNAAWDAAWGTARNAAWNAAWDAAWNAAWGTARNAAWDAALALIVKDLITPEQFEILYGPWRSAMES
jgi:hypothetical protein